MPDAMETRSKKMNILLLAKKKKMPVNPCSLPHRWEPGYRLGNPATGPHMLHGLAVGDCQPLSPITNSVSCACFHLYVILHLSGFCCTFPRRAIPPTPTSFHFHDVCYLWSWSGNASWKNSRNKSSHNAGATKVKPQAILSHPVRDFTSRVHRIHHVCDTRSFVSLSFKETVSECWRLCSGGPCQILHGHNVCVTHLTSSPSKGPWSWNVTLIGKVSTAQ